MALPLGFVTMSFRQLATMAISFLVAYGVSLLFQFPIAGVSFGGRAAAKRIANAIQGLGEFLGAKDVAYTGKVPEIWRNSLH